MLDRRGFLSGLAAALCAPAIIRTPGLLMPVKMPNPLYHVINLKFHGSRQPVTFLANSDGPMTASEVEMRLAIAYARMEVFLGNWAAAVNFTEAMNMPVPLLPA